MQLWVFFLVGSLFEKPLMGGLLTRIVQILEGFHVALDMLRTRVKNRIYPIRNTSYYMGC